VAEPLRVLVVEDNADDAALMARELRRGGFAVQSERVETAAALEQALQGEWDLVISDYSLPHFSGLDALRIVRERKEDLPFIIVSGAISEDTAVAAMKAGAHDYVLKNNLARLGPAVSRELREAQLRRERSRVQAELSSVKEEAAAELRRSRDQLEVILRGVAEGVIAQEAGGQIVYVNDTAARSLGFQDTEELLRTTAAEADRRFEIWDESDRLLPPAFLLWVQVNR